MKSTSVLAFRRRHWLENGRISLIVAFLILLIYPCTGEDEDFSVVKYKTAGENGSGSGISTATPSFKDCLKYCHQYCERFRYDAKILGSSFPVRGYEEVQLCENANRRCDCGPKPADFNLNDCNYYCYRSCHQAIEVFDEEKEKCERIQSRCGCRPDLYRQPTQNDCKKYCAQRKCLNTNVGDSRDGLEEFIFCATAKEKCPCGSMAYHSFGRARQSLAAFVVFGFLITCMAYFYRRKRQAQAQASALHYRENVDLERATRNHGGLIALGSSSSHWQNRHMNPVPPTPSSVAQSAFPPAWSPPPVQLPPPIQPGIDPDPPPPYPGIPGPK